MDIKIAKELKEKLEHDVFELLAEFEQTTGLQVGDTVVWHDVENGKEVLDGVLIDVQLR